MAEEIGTDRVDKPSNSGTNPRKLLGSGSIYALASIAPILSTLLITPVVTRALGAADYGIVAVSVTLYQLGGVLLSLGLPAAITRHAIVARSGVAGATALVAFGTLASLVAGGLLIAGIPIWGHLVIGPEHAWLLAWPVVSSIGLSMLALSQSLLRAVNKVLSFVTLSCVAAILGPGLGLLSVSLLDPSANGFLTGLATGHALAGLASLLIVLRIARPKFSWHEIKANLRIGWPTLPHSVAMSLLLTILVIVAAKTVGLEDAGRLQLALLLGTAPLILLGAFNNSWAPMIYRTNDAQRAAVLSDTLRAIAVLVFVLVAGFCVLAEPVVSFIAGPALFNTDLLTASILVAAATPFMALYLANVHLVFLSGKTTPLAFTTPASLAVSLVAVTAAAALFQTSSIVVFALGVVVFHSSQWVMSTFLSQRSGYGRPRIAPSLPPLGLAFALTVTTAILLPSILVLLITFVLIGILVIFSNRSVLRTHDAPTRG